MERTKRQSYGSNVNILSTDLDAVYTTQMEGIEAFRFDVPDGTYALSLHFAELHSDIVHKALAYNLDGEKVNSKSSHERIFSVSVNNNLVLDQISNKGQLVPEKAIAFHLSVEARDGKGISVKFTDIKGEAILNGIQVQRIR